MIFLRNIVWERPSSILRYHSSPKIHGVSLRRRKNHKSHVIAYVLAKPAVATQVCSFIKYIRMRFV